MFDPIDTNSLVQEIDVCKINRRPVTPGLGATNAILG